MSPYEFLCAASEAVFKSNLARIAMRVEYRTVDGKEVIENDVTWERIQELQQDPGVLAFEVK